MMTPEVFVARQRHRGCLEVSIYPLPPPARAGSTAQPALEVFVADLSNELLGRFLVTSDDEVTDLLVRLGRRATTVTLLVHHADASDRHVGIVQDLRHRLPMRPHGRVRAVRRQPISVPDKQVESP